MPAIQHQALAAYGSPGRRLSTRNGGSDDNDENSGPLHGLSSGVMAAIIVSVLVVVALLACCCCCCRRRRKGKTSSDKEDGSGGSNKAGLDPTKYIKKAIKKCMKKVKKMVFKKNKKAAAAGTTANFNQASPYGQGTHPGYGQNEGAMGHSGGYDRLEGDHEERLALASSPYGARSDH